jgi:hypothetical protein
MNFIDDDRVHIEQAGRCIRREQQIERLRSSDEDGGGMPPETAALLLRSVPRADADLRWMDIDSCPLSHGNDAGKRRPEVAFYIDCQSFERADIDHAAAGVRCHGRLKHQAVETPEKGG